MNDDDIDAGEEQGIDAVLAAALADIPIHPTAAELEEPLRRLAETVNGADKIRRSCLRQGAIRKLEDLSVKGASRLVDAAIEKNPPPAAAAEKAVAFEALEPSEYPVIGDELLDELEEQFPGYCILPEMASAALALWILHTFSIEAFDISPRLAVTSPAKRCGKSTLLRLVHALCLRPLSASNVSAASIFRGIEKYRPTLLIDEADTFLRENEELRGILNAGHARISGFVLRVEGEKLEPALFRCYGPVAIALIGKLPATLEDRSIEISMSRRRPGETVERMRWTELFGRLRPLRERCLRWATEIAEDLRAADPELPPELDDRAADNWRPLVAIADLAGGRWPERAREAARVLSAARTETEGASGLQLLEDLRMLFGGRDRITTSGLVAELERMEERPWPEFRRGKPITPRQVASLLRPFGIRPTTIRLTDGAVSKGYLSESCIEAFSRYLPPSPPSNPLHPLQ
jgi:hypothetical protein